VLIAAMTAEFNDQVISIALTDVSGALGISHDSQTWIESLYVSAEIIGMAISPWLLTTFTLMRWTLVAIALCGTSSVLIPFSPNIEAIYSLRLLQGLAGGLIIPLLMATAFRVLTPNIRLYGLAVYALTATFTPALAATVAAFWTDVVDWRFVFFANHPTLLFGRCSRVVLPASGSAEIRTPQNAGLARRAASDDWDRRLEHDALSGGPARLVQLKTDLRPGSDERCRHPVAAGR
jgi:MFS family permease